MTDFDAPPPPNPRPAVHYSRPTKTGDTVTIACKMPGGLILRVFDWLDYKEPMRDGTMRDARRAVPKPDAQFVVKGPWVATGGQAYNRTNGAVMELLPGGFAITDGCPKEIWDGWYEQNKHSDLVKNGIIFGYKDRDSAVKEVRKHSSVVTGLEPIDPANPAAKMGSIQRGLKFGVLEQGDNDR